MKSSPYGSIKYNTVSEYHSNFKEAIQNTLQQLRAEILKVALQAVEVISYNMPAFKMNKVLVYYAVNKEHIGFYPTPSPILAFKDELANYKTSKGAIQFPLNKPLPLNLIAKIVKFRLIEDSEKGRKAMS